jgi:alpha-beta hydrolase superfamily lysophospholipase
MLQDCRGLLLSGLLVGLGLFLPCGRVAAQAKAGDKGEPVKITTIDGVDLHGMFFQSPKKDAATIILVHALGDKGLQKSYLGLAEKLQPNYSVMAFDLRGHGKSKDIDPAKFWLHPANVKMVKGAPKKTTIEYVDFDKGYYPVLANDIAAVKAYLDRKNDAGACNTSSTILLGAETGATLGAVWLNSEWHLYRLIPNVNPVLPPQRSPNPEGKDIIACIWLSPSAKLGIYAVKLSKTLEVPVRQMATPTVFIYGEQDSSGKSLAEALDKALKDPKDNKYSFNAAYPVKGTNLKGMSLLQPSTQTTEAIIDYLEKVVEKKANEPTKRDFRTSQYVWQVGGITVPAKVVNEPSNLVFDTYEKFIGR